ncbi:hypothetical protein PTI45_02102 [Paenibacillus nuruki]|uniref:Uncharacterized protein n=1 Tax=Paenibacillus nuruki TaxID=1886670 RepID=A0A1E3L415_9BACL|nr:MULTISPECIES: DUF5316 family protein [Paenibacillus]ODP28557.1 hypothetical protein PTI45_02102 [Paenibacillus nuruki]TKJ86246.1 hypothetical protein PaeCFBP13512_19605 [Paenibacillus sp. CFBP13512]
MKKTGLLLGSGALFLVVLYFVQFVLPYEFEHILQVVAVILIVITLALSGTLVSGDRMRANQAIDPTSRDRGMVNSWSIILFSLPVYMVLIILYLWG